MDLRRNGGVRGMFPEEFQNEENDPSGILKAFLDIVDAKAITGAWVSSSSGSSESSLSSNSLSSESSFSSSLSSSSASYSTGLIRSSSGLLYGRDVTINPFVTGDLAHWDKPSASFQLSISSGSLQCYYSVPTDDASVCRNNQVSPVSKLYVYASIEAVNNGYAPFIGVSAHVDDITYGIQDNLSILMRNNAAYGTHVREVVDGAYNDLDNVGTTAPYGTFDFWEYVDGSSVVAYDSFNTYDFSGTASTLVSGYPGIVLFGGFAVTRAHSYIAMSDRYVTVNNLNTGDTIEIRKSDDTVLASASESGGSASVDLYKVVIPDCNKVVVVRGAVDEFTYTVSAGEFICGGDVYTIN